MVLAGFGPSYYFRAFTDAPPLSELVRLHAALFSGWMVLFALQVSLVALKRTDLHRRWGVLGLVFALALLVVGYMTAVAGARTGWAGPRAERDAAAALSFLVVPFRDLVLFGGFLSAAVHFRRQPETHKRLMILAIVGGILPAALGRLPVGVARGSGLAFLLAGPIYDRWSRGYVHPAYKWAIPLLVVSPPLATMIGRTNAWRAFGTWLISSA
jgi:hypothetical protein